MTGRFVRLAERGREPVSLRIDGQPVRALAGFCLMGDGQDCRVRRRASPA